MKPQRLLLFFLLLSSQLFGQSQTTYTEDDLRDLANLGPNSPGIRAIDLTYEGVKGTTFLSEDWQKGAFLLKGKDAFSQDIHIQLDLMKQVVYFRLNNGFVGTLPATKLEAIRLNTGEDQFRIFRIYPEAEVEGSNTRKVKFYEELYTGAFTLLKQHYKQFVEADYKGAYRSGRAYDEYVDQHHLWLRAAGHPFHKIKMKKKHIEKAIPNYADGIQKALKSNKISLQQEKDLIQLLDALEL
jgi:hypothetical protein